MNTFDKVKEIQPQGKRKHKIIFRASFENDTNDNLEVEKVLANSMGKMGLFN